LANPFNTGSILPSGPDATHLLCLPPADMSESVEILSSGTLGHFETDNYCLCASFRIAQLTDGTDGVTTFNISIGQVALLAEPSFSPNFAVGAGLALQDTGIPIDNLPHDLRVCTNHTTQIATFDLDGTVIPVAGNLGGAPFANVSMTAISGPTGDTVVSVIMDEYCLKWGTVP
jgi:hypothetical protein